MTAPAKKRKPRKAVRWYVVVEVGNRETARWACKEMRSSPPQYWWAGRVVRCEGVLR